MTKSMTFIKVTTSKSVGKVQAHAKYIGFRSREKHQNERGLFDRTKDNGAQYREFVKSLKEKPSLWHSQSNKAFKVVLSWREKDARELGIHSEERYKDIARNYVSQLEKDKGMKLDYVGAVHMKDEHPHIHLIISGVGKNKENGRDNRLRIDFKHDLPNQKAHVDKDIGADRLQRDREVDERLRGVEQEKIKQPRERESRYSTSRDVTKDVFKTLERISKRARFDSERARQQNERELKQKESERERER